MSEDFKNMERLEKQLGVEIVSYGLGCDEYRYEITNEDKYFDCKIGLQGNSLTCSVRQLKEDILNT